MTIIHVAYADLLDFVDRLSPDVEEVVVDVVAVDGALDDAVAALGCTAAAEDLDSLRAGHVSDALADVEIRSANVLVAARRAATEWEHADRRMKAAAAVEGHGYPT